MWTYLAVEIRRIFRDPFSLPFTVGIPAFIYIIFGTTMEWGEYEIGNGNVSAYIMINMAAYGAVTATTGVSGAAAVERMQGWGRQLGLTPMPDSRFVIVKTLIGMIQAAMPVGLIFAIGHFTQAKAVWWVWLASGVLVMIGAMLFSMYGLAVGSMFRSESAPGVAASALVILGFLGNVFMPLSGTMLTIAKFTPLYGIASLARRPLTEGYAPNLNDEDGALIVEPLWESLVNVGVWVTIFSVAALLLVRRGRERQ